MAFRRGFFRLWIVASVLWVVFLTVFSWGGIQNPGPHLGRHVVYDAVNDTFEVKETGYFETLSYAETYPGLTQIEIKPADGAPIYLLVLPPDSTAEKDMPLFERGGEASKEHYLSLQSELRLEFLLVLIPLAIGVPLVVLGLGFVAGWIIAGFRNSPRSD